MPIPVVIKQPKVGQFLPHLISGTVHKITMVYCQQISKTIRLPQNFHLIIQQMMALMYSVLWTPHLPPGPSSLATTDARALIGMYGLRENMRNWITMIHRVGLVHLFSHPQMPQLYTGCGYTTLKSMNTTARGFAVFVMVPLMAAKLLCLVLLTHLQNSVWNPGICLHCQLFWAFSCGILMLQMHSRSLMNHCSINSCAWILSFLIGGPFVTLSVFPKRVTLFSQDPPEAPRQWSTCIDKVFTSFGFEPLSVWAQMPQFLTWCGYTALKSRKKVCSVCDGCSLRPSFCVWCYLHTYKTTCGIQEYACIVSSFAPFLVAFWCCKYIHGGWWTTAALIHVHWCCLSWLVGHLSPWASSLSGWHCSPKTPQKRLGNFLPSLIKCWSRFGFEPIYVWAHTAMKLLFSPSSRWFFYCRQTLIYLWDLMWCSWSVLYGSCVKTAICKLIWPVIN